MILLPAAVDLSRVSRSAQDSRSMADVAGVVLAILGVFAAFWLLMYLWNRYRREVARAASDPRALFYELCRAHGLSRKERNLLWTAAIRYRLEHPALVFALPHYVHQLADGNQPCSTAYARLAVRLFGSTAGPAESVGPESTIGVSTDTPIHS
jgi:hypothetical protein